jgi:hypothetical protein
MRTLTTILLFLTLTTTAQVIPKEAAKPMLIKSGLMAIAGACDATAEVVRINYSYFDAVFPNANPQFWDAKQSQGNKWKDGNSKNGEKFFLSSTALAWTTDGYHLMRTTRNIMMITALVIPIGKRKNWKQYVVEGVVYYCAYTGGFTLMYNGVFKMP